MNDNTTQAPQSTSKTSGLRRQFFKRQLFGTAFLSLEHFTYMLLVVIVPLLLVAGMYYVFGLWSRALGADEMLVASSVLGIGSASATLAHMALGVVAALIVLVPAMLVLERRTRLERHKRTGYTLRLAYKLPVYGALFAVSAITAGLVIQIVQALITAVAYIGVNSAPYAALFTDTILPSLAAVLVYSVVIAYVCALAKGRDYGRQFCLGVAGVAIALAAVLFAASTISLHETVQPPYQTSPTSPQYNGNQRYLDDLLRDLY